MIQVLHFTNPFEPAKGCHRYTGRRGESINQWLKRQFGEDFVEFEIATICQLNGKPLLREKWDKRLKEGDALVFVTLPGGIETIIIAVIAVVVAVAAYLLIPDPLIPADQTQASGNNVYTLRGQTNRLRPGEPIEVIYGRCRCWPTLISRSYSRYIGNESYQYSLYVLGQGGHEILGMFFDDTNVSSFSNVEVEVCPPNTEVTLVEAAVYHALEVSNIELLAPNEPGSAVQGPFVLNDYDKPIRRIEVDVSFGGGLYRMNDKGKIIDYSIELLFEYREVNAGGVAIGDWTDLVNPTITRADNTPQRITYSHAVPSGRYQIRGRRVTDKVYDTKYVSQCRWEDAKGYARFKDHFGDITVIAVKALATNKLNDQTSKSFNVRCIRKLPTWTLADGWGSRVSTRNPVWAFCDLFRSKYGAKLATLYLDMPTLKALADKLDDRSDWFDWIFDQPLTVWEAAKVVMRVCRSIPIPQGSLVTVVRDEAQTAFSGFFGAYNITKGSLTKKLSMFEFNPFDGLIIEYTDLNTWKPKEVKCILPGREGNNLDRLKLPGCTNRNRAFREGKYIQSRRELQRKTITFTTGLEGHIPTIMDLIAVTHDTVRVGQNGYVLAYDTGTKEVTLSEQPEFGDLHIVHRIAFRGKDGAIVGDAIDCTPGTAPNKVILDEHPDDAFDFSADQVPPLYGFGIADLWTFKAKVISVKPLNSKSVEVTCVNYVDNSYIYDEEETVEVETIDMIFDPSDPVVSRVDITPVPNVPDRVFIDWPPIAGAAGYMVQVSYDNTNWTPLTSVPVPPVQTGANQGTMWARVAPFALGGNVIWTVSPSYIVGSNIAVPGAPAADPSQDPFTGLTATAKWLATGGAGGYAGEIWLTGGGAALRTFDVGLGLSTSYTYANFIADGGTTGRSFDFKVTAWNVGGDSATTTITRANPVPVAPTGVTVGTPSGSVFPIAFTHTPEADFLEYRVYASVTAGFTPGPSNLVDTVASSPGHVTTAVNMYCRVAALDKWDGTLALSAEVPIIAVAIPAWISASTDYFLTSAWGTTTGVNSTGNVNAWVGGKAVMSSTRSTNDAVRTGMGADRRCIQPKGNLQVTGHPTGSVGAVFAFRRTNTNFCRFINTGSYVTGWYILGPGSTPALDGYTTGSAGNSSVLIAETGPTYIWHSIAIKYHTVTSTVPTMWVDGVELTTSKTVGAAIHDVMKRFGDQGAYDDFELGDFAFYAAPSNADMASYGADVAAKWQAP